MEGPNKTNVSECLGRAGRDPRTLVLLGPYRDLGSYTLSIGTSHGF